MFFKDQEYIYFSYGFCRLEVGQVDVGSFDVQFVVEEFLQVFLVVVYQFFWGELVEVYLYGLLQSFAFYVLYVDVDFSSGSEGFVVDCDVERIAVSRQFWSGDDFVIGRIY